MPATSDRAGRTAEAVAALWLRLKGFRVLARRIATPVGEIDLVALRGDLLVFVEVKRRAGLDAALEAVGPRQRRRIARAADWFLMSRPKLRHCRCRFDLLAVTPWRVPLHLPGAWRLDG